MAILGLPGSHFGFCRRCGVAGGERVPPSLLGWYLILILMSSLTWFICSYNCLLELRLAIRIWQSNIDQCDNLVQGYFMKNKRLKSIIALIFGVVFIFQFVFLVGVWVCFSLYPLGWAHSFRGSLNPNWGFFLNLRTGGLTLSPMEGCLQGPPSSENDCYA